MAAMAAAAGMPVVARVAAAMAQEGAAKEVAVDSAVVRWEAAVEVQAEVVLVRLVAMVAVAKMPATATSSVRSSCRRRNHYTAERLAGSAVLAEAVALAAMVAGFESRNRCSQWRGRSPSTRLRVRRRRMQSRMRTCTCFCSRPARW